MRALRLLASAAALAGLYTVGALLTYRFLTTPGAGASFFPPAGLSLAALLLTPRRTWPLWLAAIGIAEFSLDLFHNDLSVFMSLGFATANVVEPLVGAALVVLWFRHRTMTPRGFLNGYVLYGVGAGPFVGGVIGGAVVAIAGSNQGLVTGAEWWLGDALGVLVVATPILAWRDRDMYRTPAKLPEIVGLAALALTVTIAPALFLHESFAYLALPVLMLAARRGGPFAVSTSGVGVALGASWIVSSGHARALITARGAEGGQVDTQLFIAITLLAALTLAVEVGERTKTERVLRNSERRRARAELAAVQAAVSERRRIVRETHDIVGHALNVMILSGAAARRVLSDNPEQARELLATVENVGRDAFRDLDVALGLADQSPDIGPLKGIADIDELVDRLVQAGMRVEYRVEGAARPLPRLVDGSAYRIVQESLTNVARHAVNAQTRVLVRFEPDTLFLEVTNNNGASHSGTGNGTSNGNGNSNGNGSSNGGRGLLGMRERVAVLGGNLVAGPTADDGYSVVAQLPVEQV